MSAVAAVVAGNLAPPDRGMLPVLVGAAGVVVALGLLRGSRGWWVAAGFLVGLAACAAAPRAPASGGARAVPVRFCASVRDGWRAGVWGWSTRVRVSGVEAAGEAVATPSELRLTLAGELTPPQLPEPGSRWSGSGELAFDRTFPLRRPQLRVKSLLLLNPEPGGGVIDRLRQAGVEALYSAADVDPGRMRAASLAAALALGRPERLSAGEVSDLRRSGLAHLLAVSGLHVGLVAALAWGMLLLAGVRPRSRRWVLVVVIAVFALISGGGAPVRRAASAGIAYLLARQLGRPLVALPVVWAVVAGLTLVEPDAVLQPGFQLSALVTLALVRWAGPLAARLDLIPRPAATAAAVTVIAQCAASPLVGIHFGGVPLLGVLVNLVAAPLGMVLTALSLLTVVAAMVAPPVAALLLSLLALPQGTLDALAGAGSWASATFAPLPWQLLPVLGAVSLLALLRWRPARAFALVVPVFTVGWLLWPHGSRVGKYEVRMLAVSDGMSILLRSGPGSSLVDCGRAPGEAVGLLAAQGVRRLDGLLLTHPDADHIGGAAGVLSGVRVGRLLYPAVVGDVGEMVELRRLARSRGVLELPVVPGQRVTLGAISWDVLWPVPGVSGSDNDASLVAAAQVGPNRVLITGDIEIGGEIGVMHSGLPLCATVLQLPHHGSATSSSASFLAAADPLLALVACGRRPRYPYPARAVVGRVRRLPALLVSQSAGLETVWWGEDGRIMVSGTRPVAAPVGRGAR